MRAAVALWRYCAESAEVLFNIAAGHRVGAVDSVKARKVLDYLHKHNRRWVSQTAISTEVFGKNMEAAEIRAAA